jgi:hypothetical protein
MTIDETLKTIWSELNIYLQLNNYAVKNVASEDVLTVLDQIIV